jgi:hypothetical protein
MAAAAAVVVVLVAGGLLWLGQRPRVAMVGDSLLFDSRDEVHNDLHRWRATVSAFPGTTIGQQLPEASRLVATRPRALVIVLGANNTIDGVKPNDLAELDQMLDAVSSVPCVRWLSVADATPRPTFNVAAKEFDDALRAHAAKHPNVTIVDWAATARPHPDWYKPGDIHLLEPGQAAMAKVISGSLDGC